MERAVVALFDRLTDDYHNILCWSYTTERLGCAAISLYTRGLGFRLCRDLGQEGVEGRLGRRHACGLCLCM